MRQAKLTRAKRIADLPDAAIAEIMSGTRGLDAILNALALDGPTAPTAAQESDWNQKHVADDFE